MGKSEHLFSENDHHRTPKVIWGPIVEAWGSIGLDPFWNPKSNVPARHRWTNWKCVGRPLPGVRYEFDSFDPKIRWSGYGLVYANGPFSRAGEYLRRCAEDGDEVIFLAKTNMNATYVHKYVRTSEYVCFLDKRVTYDGNTTQAPFHTLLGYWGARGKLFKRTFGKLGWVVRGESA